MKYILLIFLANQLFASDCVQWQGDNDTDHPPGIVGAGKNKPKTSWELHPIIDFEVVR